MFYRTGMMEMKAITPNIYFEIPTGTNFNQKASGVNLLFNDTLEQFCGDVCMFVHYMLFPVSFKFAAERTEWNRTDISSFLSACMFLVVF